MKPIKIAITTGDPDGVGTEVSAKALQKIRPIKNVYYYYWRSPRTPKKHLQIIDSAFHRVTVSSWPEALNTTFKSHQYIIDICSPQSPANWIETSARAGLFNHIDGLVTAPVSKTSILSSGFKDIGHTDILKRITKTKSVYMAFLGSEFNVLLMTGHVPLSDIKTSLTKDQVKDAFIWASRVRQILPTKVKRKPLALVGLNPHAGENGIIGDLENKILIPVMNDVIKKLHLDIVGPLVPDAAFFKENWKKFSLFICPYHDQGLIPFKMIHEQDSGVHLTLGLPFIRTSVDHGTAKNIFNKNKANPKSMIEAIQLCVYLCKNSNETKKITP